MPNGKDEREKVPKRLLTDEQIEWQKRYKHAKNVAEMSNMGIFGIRRLMAKAVESMANLLRNKPERQMIELAQQPEPEGE